MPRRRGRCSGSSRALRLRPVTEWSEERTSRAWPGLAEGYRWRLCWQSWWGSPWFSSPPSPPGWGGARRHRDLRASDAAPVRCLPPFLLNVKLSFNKNIYKFWFTVNLFWDLSKSKSWNWAWQKFLPSITKIARRENSLTIQDENYTLLKIIYLRKKNDFF